MTPNGLDFAQGFVTLATLVGLWQLRGILLKQGKQEQITRRFLFSLHVVFAIFMGRFLALSTGIDQFWIIVLIGGAMMPLAVLILAEGLLRRHAAGWLKRSIAVATVFFAAIALWFGSGIDVGLLWGLLGYQVIALTCVGIMIWRREKQSLSPSENQTVVRLGLSLILIVPLAAVDFLTFDIGIPLQLSGIAVLFLCWLVLGLGRSDVGHRASLIGFATICSVMLAAGLCLKIVLGLNGQESIVATAVLLSATLVLVVLLDARAILAEASGQSLVQFLASAPIHDGRAFMDSLATLPLFGGANLLEGATLADFSSETLQGMFERRPVLKRDTAEQLLGEAADHATHLFDRFEASHILLVSQHPMALMAMNVPALSAGADFDTELELLSRMARLANQTGEPL